MKTTVRVFDGMDDGKCEQAEKIIQIKIAPYEAAEQLSGSDRILSAAIA